jgi:hypothetical protein
MFYRIVTAALILATASQGAWAADNSPKPPARGVQAASTVNPFVRTHRPLKPQQPIPAGLSCPDGVVWASKSGKVFHGPASRYYGRGDGGSYGCRAQAVAAGLTQSAR